MSPLRVLAAAVWFVAQLALALGLDAVDRLWRETHLQAALADARATADAMPLSSRATPGPADPDMPQPVNVLKLLTPLPGAAWPAAGEPAGVPAGVRLSYDANGPRLLVDGHATDLPGRLVASSRGPGGALYASIADANRLPLWLLPSPAEAWRPIGGSGPFDAMAAGQADMLYVAGRALGRWDGAAWTFTEWPEPIRVRSLQAHPDAPLVVALGEGRCVVSRDGGTTLRVVPLARRRATAAALDGADAGRLLLRLDDEATVYELRLEAWP